MEIIMIVTVDEEGTRVSEEHVLPKGEAKYSDYARYYHRGCPNWSNSLEYNLTFLKTQQDYANCLLKYRGHLFLNEVYDMLGLPRTKFGAVVGWAGDCHVDFGLPEYTGEPVHSWDKEILLDFNVVGCILDLL